VHNFSKDTSLEVYIAKHPHLESLSESTKKALKKQSEKCKKWIRLQRSNLIGHWDLPDGEAPEKPKKKRAVAVVTVESVEASSDQKMERLSHERSVVQYNVLARDLGEPTITMTVSENESVASASHRHKKNARPLAIEPVYPNSEPEDEHSMVAPAPANSQSIVVYSAVPASDDSTSMDPSTPVAVVDEVPTPVMNVITLQHLLNAIPSLSSEQGVVMSVDMEGGILFFRAFDSEEATTLNLADIVKDYTF